jgi:hypothetical protein
MTRAAPELLSTRVGELIVATSWPGDGGGPLRCDGATLLEGAEELVNDGGLAGSSAEAEVVIQPTDEIVAV